MELDCPIVEIKCQDHPLGPDAEVPLIVPITDAILMIDIVRVKRALRVSSRG